MQKANKLTLFESKSKKKLPNFRYALLLNQVKFMLLKKLTMSNFQILFQRIYVQQI